EATELLTALTKLEDKIVPEAKNQRTRLARALAGLDELDRRTDFGDEQSGWKDRLAIPPVPVRAHEAEPPAPPVPEGNEPPPEPVATAAQEQTPSPISAPVEPVPQVLEAVTQAPPDPTFEEIVAIASAAASFEEPNVESHDDHSAPAQVLQSEVRA